MLIVSLAVCSIVYVVDQALLPCTSVNLIIVGTSMDQILLRCVSVCIYVCMYVHVCMHIRVCMRAYLCVCACVCTYILRCACVCVCACVCMCVCVCVLTALDLCVSCISLGVYVHSVDMLCYYKIK